MFAASALVLVTILRCRPRTRASWSRCSRRAPESSATHRPAPGHRRISAGELSEACARGRQHHPRSLQRRGAGGALDSGGPHPLLVCGGPACVGQHPRRQAARACGDEATSATVALPDVLTLGEGGFADRDASLFQGVLLAGRDARGDRRLVVPRAARPRGVARREGTPRCTRLIGAQHAGGVRDPDQDRDRAVDEGDQGRRNPGIE